MSSENDLTGLGELTALLGKGTEFDGKLFFEGRVRIDGRVKGTIQSTGILVLGEEANIQADIEVGTLILRGGTLRGQINASELVEIHNPSHVFGDIHAPQIQIDKGVVFEGECFMDPTRSEAP